MFKKLTILVLILAIVSSCTISMVFAADSTTTVTTQNQKATALKDLGILSGMTGFDLNKPITKTEAVVIYLRLLGKDSEVKKSTYKNIFKDVPAWALKYIAYACNKGYATGTSKTTFGSSTTVSPEQFLTLMLKALGYSDKAGDFTVNTAIQKAEKLSIVPTGKFKAGLKSFNRGNCTDIIFSVLGATKKGATTTLTESLIDCGAIDSKVAAKFGFYKDSAPISTKTPTQKPTTTHAPTSASTSVSAQNLYDLGLFNKSDFSGSSIFSLDRAPTKLEATVMYIKMLGKEQTALAMNNTDARSGHPFTDVPAWAKKYVAYVYWNKLLSGTTDNTFGSDDKITIEQFLTYVLDALGYDSNDFYQTKSIAKAEEIGLIPVGKYTSNSKFTCSDCADIIFNALKLNKKLEGITLTQSLIYNGAISDISAAKYSLIPSAYQRIKVPIKVEGTNNMLYNQDVISAIPNAKFVGFGGIGTGSKIPFSYYLAFNYSEYNDLSKTASDASIYKYFTENNNNLNNYVGDKPGNGFTIATVYDSSFNIVATAIFDAKSAIEAGNVEFVVINFDTKKYIDYLTALSNKIIGTAKELPSDAFYFERYKEMVTIIDKATGKQKGDSFLDNDGSYSYKLIINKDKYPELASAITGFNDIFINDQPITADSLKKEVTSAMTSPFSNSRYIMSFSIDNPLSNWSSRDYEWSRKRAFVFGDANGSIIGWVNYLPSQVKIVDIGTINTTIKN